MIHDSRLTKKDSKLPATRYQIREGGFTLVELVVALSVFAISVALASGAFIRALWSERELTNAMAVNNTVSTVVEQMARELRLGSDFRVSDPPAGSANEGRMLTFRNREGSNTSYAFVGGALMRNGATRLTSENIMMQNGVFALADRNDFCAPWRVTVRFGVVPKAARRAEITMQTSVSSRLLPADLNVDENPADGINDYQTCKDRLAGTGTI